MPGLEVEEKNVVLLIGNGVEGNCPPVRRVGGLGRLVDRKFDSILLCNAALADIEEQKGPHPLGAAEDRHVITIRREREVSALTGSDGQTLRHEVAVLVG